MAIACAFGSSSIRYDGVEVASMRVARSGSQVHAAAVVGE